MSRLKLIIIFMFTLICSYKAQVSSAADALNNRPNILWITCEDISPHLSCYGDAFAKTPTLDQLASEGVLYTHAFATAGVCAPARSCIITGVFPSSLGSHHMRCTGTIPSQLKLFPAYLKAAGYYCTNNSKTDYNLAWSKDNVWDETSSKAHWRSRKDQSQPFFAVFNDTGTHEGKIASESTYKKLTENLSDQERQDRSKVKLPPYYPDTAVTREHWARNYELITAYDHRVKKLLDQLEEDGLADNTIVFYYSDHGVGLPRAKRWLYDSGMHIPLIVRMPEKFRTGEQGKPGTIADELVSFVDLAPTVLNLCGIEIPKFMQGRAFLGKQLSPKRKYVFGARDRMDERYDIIRAVRDHRYKYIRNYEPTKAYYQYMNTPEKGAIMQELRRLHTLGELPKGAEQFMANSKPIEELYDTESDPHEMVNLVAKPEYQEKLKEMRTAHQNWVARTIDVGLIPEPEIRAIERKEKMAIYDYVRKGAGFPIDRVRETASFNASSIDQIQKRMQDPIPSIRFWAAYVLANLIKTKQYQLEGELLTLLQENLEDSSPMVRISVARALALADQSLELALKVLQQDLSSEHQWVRLNAAIVLDELDEKANPPFLL